MTPTTQSGLTSAHGPIPAQLPPRRDLFLHRRARDRTSSALTHNIGALRAAVRIARHERPFAIDAIVVLPDHLHALWTLPSGDADFPGRWKRIKAHFTHRLVAADVPVKRHRNGEYALWQRRFWEHTIRNETDFERHADYLHFNPVKHRLVSRVRDWPHSSFHAYVRRGAPYVIMTRPKPTSCGGKQACLDVFDWLSCTHRGGRHEVGAGTCQGFTNR